MTTVSVIKKFLHNLGEVATYEKRKMVVYFDLPKSEIYTQENLRLGQEVEVRGKRYIVCGGNSICLHEKVYKYELIEMH